MVRRIEVTYEGGHKEVIAYRQLILEDDDRKIYVDSHGNHITVMKNKVLQYKELS